MSTTATPVDASPSTNRSFSRALYVRRSWPTTVLVRPCSWAKVPKALPSVRMPSSESSSPASGNISGTRPRTSYSRNIVAFRCMAKTRLRGVRGAASLLPARGCEPGLHEVVEPDHAHGAALRVHDRQQVDLPGLSVLHHVERVEG